MQSHACNPLPAAPQVKHTLLELRYGASLKAEKYDAWSANAAAAAAAFTPKQREVTSNAYYQLPPDFRPVVLTADGRSATGKCFDVPYYKKVRFLAPTGSH